MAAFLAMDTQPMGEGTPGSTCPMREKAGEQFLEDHLGNRAASSMPPPGRVARLLLEEKDQWLRDCPKNEYVWYAILRASELTSADGKAPLEMVQAARNAVPDSRWIETVYARAVGTVQAARTVAERWQWHAPAKVALAAAYERSGQVEAALAILEPMLQSSDLEVVVGGPLLLGRVALALRKPALAVQAARTESHGQAVPIEPVAGMMRIEEALAMDGLARAVGRSGAQASPKTASWLTPPKCPAPEFSPFIETHLGGDSGMEPLRPGERAREFLEEEKVWWLHDCPHDEVVWYTVLRASELLSEDRKVDASLLDAARTAAPGSVWIETVRARALGTVESAQAALQLDGDHIPARIALAAAYARAGQPAVAMKILRRITSLDRHAGGPLLMARVALAMGDVRLAAETASMERIDQYAFFFFEPVSGMNQGRQAALFAGEAWMRLGKPDKALTAYLSADELADVRLLAPPDDLLSAMDKRFRTQQDKGYPHERLRAYLGVLALRQGKIQAGARMLIQLAAHVGPEMAAAMLKNAGTEVRQALERFREDPHVSQQERKRLQRIEDALGSNRQRD